MEIFNSLLKTQISKREYQYDFTKIYKKGRFATSVDSNFFENIYTLELLENNKRKKYNQDLVTLWGKLDMKSYIDYDLGDTINLYFLNCSKRIPIKNLSNYNFMPDDTRKLSLLDIKYIKHINLEIIDFKNLFLATFEIMDMNKTFRPYVLLFVKNENDDFDEVRLWL